MPRPLKPHKVEGITDRDTGEATTLYFDRDKKDFFCMVGVEEFRDPTVDGLRVKARAALQAFKPYEWKTYILVDGKKESVTYGGRMAEQFRAKLDFAFWRREVAVKQDGRILTRPVLDKDGLTDEERARDFTEENTNETQAEFFARCATYNKDERITGRDIEQVYYSTKKIEDLADAVIPFTEAAWTALHAIRQRILDAENQLDELSNQPDFAKRLHLIAKQLPKLLPGGKP